MNRNSPPAAKKEVDEPVDVALARDVVPALPPESGEPERQLGEPHEPQPEHPEEHPGPDPSRGRLPHERRPLDRVDPERHQLRDQRKQRVDAQERLIAVRPIELILGEVPRRVDARQREVPGDARLPELEERVDPRRDGGGDAEREQRAARRRGSVKPAGAPASAAAGAAPTATAAPATAR